MHHCTDCQQACFCDGDDTDYGERPLSGVCTHECVDHDDEAFAFGDEDWEELLDDDD